MSKIDPSAFPETEGADLNAPQVDVPQIEVLTEQEEDASPKTKSGNHARSGQAAYIQRSARMRRILIVVIVLLVILIGLAGFLAWQLYQTARDTAVQQTQIAEMGASTNTEETTKDASATTSKKTTVPDLVALIGTTQEEAIQKLQHGARVSSAVPVNEEDNPVKQEVRIALTEEPADSKGGTPTISLSLNEEGRAIRVGYTSSTSSLGYGSLSFSDAVTNESIVEKTLTEAGLTVPVGTVALPADKMQYSTYASDGTTLTKESYTFTGTGTAAGQERPWSATLTYDYSMANATGNLVDTIRTINVSVG
ncbi:MAG: histone-lysine N-methyltransferase [Eggerthellaceae bacterium]|nr:histone-lysine N-methyltransferase [Eggerthellaceae bacterium]